MEEPTLSPDGSRIAFIATQHDQRYIEVAAPEAGKIVIAARLNDTKVRQISWFDDSRLLILYSATSYPPEGLYGPRNEWSMLVTWDLAKNRMRPVSLHDDNFSSSCPTEDLPRRTMAISTGGLRHSAPAVMRYCR
jgi:hypothetical protein